MTIDLENTSTSTTLPISDHELSCHKYSCKISAIGYIIILGTIIALLFVDRSNFASEKPNILLLISFGIIYIIGVLVIIVPYMIIIVRGLPKEQSKQSSVSQ